MSHYLAFDFGMKHIGLAVGQDITHSATALKTLKAKDGIPDWQEIQILINDWQPAALIVGIPLNMDGTEQRLSFAASRFANRLETKFRLPVHRVDERLSSWEAKQRLLSEHPGLLPKSPQQKKVYLNKINAEAAAIILEQWLLNH